MNAVKELIMRIRSTFDGTGTSAATKAVGTDLANANTKASETAKKTGKDVADAGKRGADGLNLMSVATAAMQGNFNGAASAAIPLIEKSKAAGLSLTQLSLAGAALTAVVAGLKAISEWADAAAQRIAKIQMDNLTSKVNASAAAYEKLFAAMQKASAENDATLAFNNSLIDSYTRQALAVNELNKQKELSSVTDETLRREIEAKYSSKASEITGNSDVQKEANDRKRSFERESEIDEQIEASKRRQDELLKEAVESLSKSQKANLTAQSNMGFFGNLVGGKQSTVTAYLGMAKEAGSLTGASIDKAQEEEQRREQLEAERLAIIRSRRVASIDGQSGFVARQASDIAAQTAASDRARANQEALRPAMSSLDAELADFHSSDQQSVVSALQSLKQEGKMTVDAINQWTEYLRQIKDGLSRQRYQ